MKRKRSLILPCLLVLISTVAVILGMTASRKKGNPGPQRFASSVPDSDQFFDASAPVAVFRVGSTSERGKVYRVKEAILENRSWKNVEAVTLRWSVTTMENRENVLQRGTMETIKLKSAKKSLRANSRQTLKLPAPSLREMLKMVANAAIPSENYMIKIGVSEVVFEDNSTWKEGVQAKGAQKGRANEALETAHAPAAQPTPPTPYCAKTVCKIVLDDNGDATGLLECDEDDFPTISRQECFYIGEACQMSVCTSSLPDVDNDGYDNSVDCNDNNYYINPGVGENCGDTIDNNCDLVIDCADSSCFSEPACQPPPPPPPPGCVGAPQQPEDCDFDMYYSYLSCKCRVVRNMSPIIIDVQGDGFSLTNVDNGVSYDLDADDHAEHVAWTAASADDAFLALDRNGNGKIDNGSELFGNYTAQPVSAAPNGFLALAEYDKAVNGGNGDKAIDDRDVIFTSLRLWQDVNHNGVSEPGELRTLRSLDVTAIDLKYKESKRTDQYGNQFRYRSKVKDARGARVGRWAWDVFLTVVP